jgi:hypothetical protein
MKHKHGKRPNVPNILLSIAVKISGKKQQRNRKQIKYKSMSIAEESEKKIVETKKKNPE